MEYALSHNVTVVAAAGNNADGADPTGDGFMHTTLDYPAAYPGVIGVGASAVRNDNGVFSQGTEYVASYSQTAPTLSLVAPGGDPTGNDNDPLHWVWNYSAPSGGCNAEPRDVVHGILRRDVAGDTAGDGRGGAADLVRRGKPGAYPGPGDASPAEHCG